MKVSHTLFRLSLLVLVCVCGGRLAGAAEADFDKLEAAVRAARNHAFAPPDEGQAMANAVRGYLGTIDPYSTYITAEEYASLHNTPAHYSGVGMDLIQGPSGLLHCLPYAGSPAGKAGIQAGDVLISVNGTSVNRYPLLVLESLIRGKTGSEVAFGVVSAGSARTFTVQRENIVRASAEVLESGKVRRIRIWRFDGSTLDQLRRCLAEVSPGNPLILDLRGNVGGDLKAAVACAGLFLPDESLIVTLESRTGGPQVYRAAGSGVAMGRKLALWQDAFTASAAEVFCAALHDNGVARSFGQTTFGKGIAQSIIPADGKGFYVITTGRLSGPLGDSYHHKGLKPDYYVSSTREPVEQNYLRRTYEVFGVTP